MNLPESFSSYNSQQMDGNPCLPYMSQGPALPSLPTFTFRHYQGIEDLSAMLAVHEACRERDKIDLHSVCYTVPNLAQQAYVRLLEDAPPNATLLAEKDGAVVAHAWMEAWALKSGSTSGRSG